MAGSAALEMGSQRQTSSVQQLQDMEYGLDAPRPPMHADRPSTTLPNTQNENPVQRQQAQPVNQQAPSPISSNNDRPVPVNRDDGVRYNHLLRQESPVSNSDNGDEPYVTLPPFIRPPSSKLKSDDLEYLSRKQVFVIPETTLRNELLRCYVQFVHPYMPILDLEEFLTAVNGNQHSNSVSLLLFQAVMFAATPYVDMRYLSTLGHRDRRATRVVFYHKVKLLCDLDYESEFLAIIQAALLLTYYHETPNESKEVWYWLSVAMSLTETMTQNIDHQALNLSPRRQKLWKRIQWCLFMRDKLAALAMRRAARLSWKNFSMPLLELDDFDIEPLNANVAKMVNDCSPVTNGSVRQMLAMMCIDCSRLCVCLDDVISLVHTARDNKSDQNSGPGSGKSRTDRATDYYNVLSCNQKLDEWFESQSDYHRYFAPVSTDPGSTACDDTVRVHRAVLAGLYYSAVTAVHRPPVQSWDPGAIDLPLKDWSRRKAYDAADEITKIYKELMELNLIRYLPNTGVTTLLAAIMIHLREIKSVPRETSGLTMQKLQRCMHALKKLCSVYASAEFAFSFIDDTIRTTKVNNPPDPGPRDRPGVSRSASFVEHRTVQRAQRRNTDGGAGDNQPFLATLTDADRDLLLTPPTSQLYRPSVGPDVSDASRGENQTETASRLPQTSIGGELDLSQPRNDFDNLMNVGFGPDPFSQDGFCTDLDMEWIDRMDTFEADWSNGNIEFARLLKR